MLCVAIVYKVERLLPIESLNPCFDAWLLAAFKPHLSLFLPTCGFLADLKMAGEKEGKEAGLGFLGWLGVALGWGLQVFVWTSGTTKWGALGLISCPLWWVAARVQVNLTAGLPDFSGMPWYSSLYCLKSRWGLKLWVMGLVWFEGYQGRKRMRRVEMSLYL